MSAHARRIVITGFMCAGKTTVAGALARRLDARMIDLDYIITERERRTVSSLIDEEGEARFREAEQRALRVVLEVGAARVIALGGGAWMIPENRALLDFHNCLTVWLDAPFELCWQRITQSSEARPLARNLDDAKALYDARLETYALADLRIEVTPEKDAGSLAREIAEAL